MSDLLSEALIIFFEVLCSRIFFETFGKARFKGRIGIIQMLLLAGSVFAAARVLSGLFLVKQIVMVSIYAVFMFWHIKISIKKSFILAVLYQAMLLSIDYLTYSLNMEFSLNSGLIGKQYRLGNILVILIGKAVLLLCVMIFRKRLGKKSARVFAGAEWLKLLVFPIFTIIIVAAMLSLFGYAKTHEQAMLLVISAFGMVGMNIMVFYLINDILEREMQLYENRLFQIQSKNKLDMYQSISENFDRQKRKTHEYKNQINCIEALLEKNQYSKAKEYVKKICGRLDGGLDAIDANNAIVNAVLNTKYQEAKENGIVFVLRINDLSKLGIEDEDIVTILSNLLDNAIEACKKCDADRRILKLKFVIEDGMVKIGVRNTFNNPIIYENGEIKSTKLAQAEEHGAGIRNIIEAVLKYGGSYVIKEDGREFYFSIIIR